jgi:hypothetical protein
MQCGKVVGEYAQDESCTTEFGGSKEPLEALEGETSASSTGILCPKGTVVGEGRGKEDQERQ